MGWGGGWGGAKHVLTVPSRCEFSWASSDFHTLRLSYCHRKLRPRSVGVRSNSQEYYEYIQTTNKKAFKHTVQKIDSKSWMSRPHILGEDTRTQVESLFRCTQGFSEKLIYVFQTSQPIQRKWIVNTWPHNIAGQMAWMEPRASGESVGEIGWVGGPYLKRTSVRKSQGFFCRNKETIVWKRSERKIWQRLLNAEKLYGLTSWLIHWIVLKITLKGSITGYAGTYGFPGIPVFCAKCYGRALQNWSCFMPLYDR